MFSGRAEPGHEKNKSKYTKENPAVPEPLHETVSKQKLNICSWPVRNCGYCGMQTK